MCSVNQICPRPRSRQTGLPRFPANAAHAGGGFLVGAKMKIIKLAKNKQTTVDDCDLPMLKNFTWYALRNGDNFYVRANVHLCRKVIIISMHRLLMGFPRKEVDHIDGNGLNNCRSTNLRLATKSQNQRNRRPNKNTATGFKGVSSGCHAYIRNNGKRQNLGTFKSNKLAAKAYNAAAKKLFGKFAKLNKA